MNNIAKVTSLSDDFIFLCHLRDYNFKENTERKFWNAKDHSFKAENPGLIQLQTGDTVEFSIPVVKTIGSSFLMLILPILVFIFSFLFLSLIGLSNEPLKVFLSLALLIASFFTSKLLNKIGFKETLPIIIRKIEVSEVSKFQSQCKDCGSCTACN